MIDIKVRASRQVYWKIITCWLFAMAMANKTCKQIPTNGIFSSASVHTIHDLFLSVS